jgi:hypothetical protein
VEKYFKKVPSDILNLSEISVTRSPKRNIISTAKNWSISSSDPFDGLCLSAELDDFCPTQYFIFSAFGLMKLKEIIPY